MATLRWYYTHNGKKKLGPVSSAQLKALAALGKLLPDDMLLQEGSSKWTLARSVKGLFPATEHPAPPTRPVWPWLVFGGGVALATGLIVLVILVFGGKPDQGERQVGSVGPAKKDAQPPAKQEAKEPAPQDNKGEPPNPEKAPETVPEKAPEKAPEKSNPPGPPVQEKEPEKEGAKAFDPEPAREAAEAALAAVRQYWDELSPAPLKEPDDFKKRLAGTLLNTARAQLAAKEYDDAKVSAEQALRLIPRYPEAMKLLAQIEKARPAPKESESAKSEEAKQGETSPKDVAKKADEPPPRSELEELLLLGNQVLGAEELDLAAEVLLAAAQLAPKSEEVLAALAELAAARRQGDPDYVRLQNVYATNLKAGTASLASAQNQAEAVKAAQRCRSAVGFFRTALDAARDLAAEYPETAGLLLAAEAEVKTALKAQQQADLVVRVQGLVKDVRDLTKARTFKKAIAKFKEVQRLAPEDQGVAAAGQELEQAIKEGPGVRLSLLGKGNVLPPNSKLQVTVKVSRESGGYRGSVSVGLQGLPEGVTASPSYVLVRAGQSEAQFQLSAGIAVQPGVYRVVALGRLPEETVGAEFKLVIPGPKR
jgi:hypothetical protein